jgi:hypothetical protein
VKYIANIIGKSENRVLAANEVVLIKNFLNEIRINDYIGEEYKNVCKSIAINFIKYYKRRNQKEAMNVADYLREDVHHFTDDENRLKLALFPKLQFDDSNRVMSKSTSASKQDTFNSVVDMARILEHITSSKSLDNITSVLKSLNTTYQSVNAPRQTLVLNSSNKNRSASDEFTVSWNVNKSDNLGAIGDVFVNFPIKEVIRMNLLPFRLWLAPASINDQILDYSTFFLGINNPPKIHIHIKEISGQGIFITLPESNNKIRNIEYHFDMNIIQGSRQLTSSPVVLAQSGPYTLQKPLAQINTLSIQIYRDNILMPIIPDTFVYTRLRKVGNLITMSDAVGPEIDIYKKILYNNAPNYLTQPTRFPVGLGNLTDISTLTYKTLITALNMATPYPIVNKLLMSNKGINVKINVASFGDLLTVNDDLYIDITNTQLTTIPDFDIKINYTLIFNILSFSIPIEFICLEISPN